VIGDAVRGRDPGAVAAVGVALVLCAIALTLDLPRVAHSFKGDEATYYSLTRSLATDFDFAYLESAAPLFWKRIRRTAQTAFQ